MFATPFYKGELERPVDDGGYEGIDGYKKYNSSTEKNPMDTLVENLSSLKPDGYFKLNQYNQFYSPMRVSMETPEGMKIDENKTYKETTTRFNGSQYGYRSISGFSPRGSTWFDVSNTQKPKETPTGELDEENINMIAQSSNSGYQQPKQGTMNAEDRILSKSNDTFAPQFKRDAFRNQVIEPSGKQGEKIFIRI